MANLIFVKIRNDEGVTYDSYADYWRLVEASGFPTVELSNLPQESEDIFIFSPHNGNIAEELPIHPNLNTVLWHLERSPVKPEGYKRYICSDKLLAKEMGIEFVPMGGHEALVRQPSVKSIDICPMAYLFGRREHMVNQMKEYGLSCASNGWGEERERTLAKSRLGLCLHQDDYPWGEPLRYVLFALSSLPIMSEADSGLKQLSYDIGNALAFCRGDLFSQSEIEAMIAHNIQLLTGEHSFRANLERHFQCK